MKSTPGHSPGPFRASLRGRALVTAMVLLASSSNLNADPNGPMPPEDELAQLRSATLLLPSVVAMTPSLPAMDAMRVALEDDLDRAMLSASVGTANSNIAVSTLIGAGVGAAIGILVDVTDFRESANIGWSTEAVYAFTIGVGAAVGAATTVRSPDKWWMHP